MFLDFNTIVYIALSISIITSITALVFSIKMQNKVRDIFRSANAKDIENLMKLHSKTIEDLVTFKAESILYMKGLDERIKKKIMSAETLRFNPFKGEGIGGNQSFTSVFADENGDGVVVTSMHTRERTNVFAKPLKSWKSEYELGEEEQETINKTKTNDRKK